jgi:hypothetical protein
MVQALQSEVTIAPEKQEIKWTSPGWSSQVLWHQLFNPTNLPASRLSRIGGIKRLQKKSV